MGLVHSRSSVISSVIEEVKVMNRRGDRQIETIPPASHEGDRKLCTL